MKIKQEIPSLVLILLPFIYLGLVWSQLAESVPIHWNVAGEIDRYGSKYILLAIPFLLPGLVYVIFTLMQQFGPKEKLDKMGKKFASLKFLLTLFMSALALLIIHSSKTSSFGQPTFILVILGLLFATFGNYFRTIQPNYFIGIRTPWTLKDENVWKSTHKLAGILWFIGGIFIVILALISTHQYIVFIMLTIVAILTIIPIIHSYIKYKSIRQK